MKNVLIISNNPLSEEQHNAKTILSLLDDQSKFSLRQIYFKDDVPTYKNCKYYKITDKQVLKSIIPIYNKAGSISLYSKGLIYKGPTIQVQTNAYIKRLIRELVWKIGSIDYKRLYSWINQESVDLIFFVGGDCIFAYNFVNLLVNKIKCPMVLFITDDYLLKRNNAGVAYDIRRRLLLKRVKEVVKKCSLFITISPKMSRVYKKLLNRNSLYYAHMPNESIIDKKQSHSDNGLIVLSYTGGLHYNRWKVLTALGNAIKEFNKNSNLKVVLNIYSADKLDKKVKESLSISNAVCLKGRVNSEMIKDILAESDVLVFVESFDRKDIEATKLSFSTKIYEYMSSNKPILAIGPKCVGSIEFLSDCSISITNPLDISKDLITLIARKGIRDNVSQKSIRKYYEYTYGKHGKEQIINAIEGIMK